jgi:hypothetical protein
MRMDLIEFTTDDATVLRLAEDWVRLGRFPLVGMPASVGVPLPPWFIYIVTPVVAISRDPRLATSLVGVLNVAGVAGVVYLAARAFSPLAGLVAGVALATNPWSVLFSRKLWPNDVLAPLAILYFIALDQAVIRRRAEWAIAAVVILVLGIQIHFTFAVLGPLILAPIIVLARGQRWQALAVSLTVAVLVSVPYLVHLLTTNFADVRVLHALLAVPAQVTGDGPAFVMSWLTSWDTWYLRFVHLDRLISGRVSASAANLQTLLVISGAAVASASVVSAKYERRLRMGGLLLWALLPALLTIRHTTPLYDHYYPFLAPASAVFIAAGVDWIWTQRNRITWMPSSAALLAVGIAAAVHVIMVVRLLEFIATDYNDTYGLPLIYKDELVSQLVQFGSAAGAQAATVQDRGSPEAGGVSYLMRPHFFDLDSREFGQIGLGGPVLSQPRIADTSLLTPEQEPNLQYADGIQVTRLVTSRQWRPGMWIQVAFVWTEPPGGASSGSPVIWQVRAYDPSGTPVAQPRGLPAPVPGLNPGDSSMIVFFLPTETGDPAVPLTIGIERPDAPSPSDERRSLPIAPAAGNPYAVVT